MDNFHVDYGANNYQYFLEKSYDNRNIIKIEDIDNKKMFYIGSKYSVQRDIDKFLKQINDFNVSTIFLVFGFGAGEHIFKLLDEVGENNKILIIEPDKKVINIIKKSGYFDEILKDKRVLLSELNISIIEILSSFIDEININNIKLMVFANYDKIYLNEFKEFYKKLNDFLLTNIINMNTNISFSEQFFKCFIRNLKHVFYSVFINDFKDQFKNIPAVVVSAGPSLEKNVELLKDAQKQFIIITGIRTVSTLNAKGINPDFVCVVDPSEKMYQVSKKSLNCKSTLVFCECTNYKIVEEYEGKKIFFQEGVNLQKVTREILDAKVDSLWAGGSVAHTCTALARYMGCNPIIFIGQDFAYTNDKYHADSASDVNNNITDSNDIIFVDDINGEKVRTSKLLDTYRKNMEQFIRLSPNTLFINSTEGGANIIGTKVEPLRCAIDEYAQEGNLSKSIVDLMNKTNSINKIDVLNKVKQILDDLEVLEEKCVSAIDYSNEFLKYYEKENEKSIKPLIDNINDINSLIYNIEFIENILKPTIYKILMNPEYIEKMNEAKKETEYRLAKQVKELYEGIIKAIDMSIPYIKECITELN
ncbi:motility associated factor glycosyltransferase family protein [Candidatus Clostridium radicumherbarum]|uniref:Motility associated factor glycosyltransferase family protein n=1 Tax=Candidatus Clostridium radicumherbarum TaxID=3381662 RepID=A0ABW8TZ66_9CLOT